MRLIRQVGKLARHTFNHPAWSFSVEAFLYLQFPALAVRVAWELR